METRFVIPAGADPDAVAWPGYRPETWRELAEGCVVENLGSAWCVFNNIDGLGFVAGSDPVEAVVDPVPLTDTTPAVETPGGNP